MLVIKFVEITSVRIRVNNNNNTNIILINDKNNNKRIFFLIEIIFQYFLKLHTAQIV